jgi:hypothetical protein
MTGPSFARRWFLGLTALFALLGSAGTRAFGTTGTTPQPAPGSALLHMLPDRSHAAVIGRAYLASHPEEAGLDAVLRHLEGLTDASGDVRGAIAARLRRDFEERDTVRLDGWVLARTEARLCALCALLNDRERPVARLSRDAPAQPRYAGAVPTAISAAATRRPSARRTL